MGDLDFEDLDRAINDLYESLDDDLKRSIEEEIKSSDHKDKGEDKKEDVKSDESLDRAEHKIITKKEETILDAVDVTEDSLPKHDGRQVVIDNVAHQAVKDLSTKPKHKQADNSDLTDKGQGHFMDMVHPSSDANVQHKHNFASERQAELDRREAEETAVIEEAAETKSSKIAIMVDDGENAKDGDLKPVPTKSNEPEDASTIAIVDESIDGVDTIKLKPARALGRRSVQYRHGSDGRHNLQQPLPAATEEAKQPEPEKTYETPFLPNAKVKKRPLGGASHSSAQTSHDDFEELTEGDLARSETEPTEIRHRAHARHSKTEDKPIATRPSAVNYRTMQVADRKIRIMRAVSRLLLFIAIMVSGGLIGLAFYYFGL